MVLLFPDRGASGGLLRNCGLLRINGHTVLSLQAGVTSSVATDCSSSSAVVICYVSNIGRPLELE
jgi:hypothetical protein